MKSIAKKVGLVASAALVGLVSGCYQPEAFHANTHDNGSAGVSIIPSIISGSGGASAGSGHEPSGAGGNIPTSGPDTGNAGVAGSTSSTGGGPGDGPPGGSAHDVGGSAGASGGADGRDAAVDPKSGAGSNGGAAGERDAGAGEARDGSRPERPDAEHGDDDAASTADVESGDEASAASVRINAGGPAVAPFAEDSGFVGGAPTLHLNTIHLSGVLDPAPTAVYQTSRVGAFTYTISGFTSGTSHLVRLHFAETYFPMGGQRICDISAGTVLLFKHFDIVAAAGAMNTVTIQEATLTANADGAFVIQFKPFLDQCLVSGIEVR